MQEVSRYLYRTEISAIVAYFCPNLVAVATPFAPLIIQITYLNSPTPKTKPCIQKVSRHLYRTEISAIVAYFCPNLVAMATPLAPLKIQIPYLNSATPNTTFYIQKVSRYLVQNRNQYKLASFCPNLVAMAITFAPLKIQITYLNSPTAKTTPYMQKVSRYLYRTEISAILAYFCPNLFAMATPFGPLKI